MKKSIKRVFSLLCMLFMVATFSSCDSGPTICDCYEKMQNPMNLSGKDVEDCSKKFREYSPNELRKKYEDECK